MIQSVERALVILNTLAAEPDGLPLRDLAARASLKGPTAHHLLATLQQAGFVERLPSPPRYRLGPAVDQLAARRRDVATTTTIDSLMADAAEAFPAATVVYCELVGGEVLTRRRLSPDLPGRVQQPPHQVMSPYISASALCLQAFATDEQRLALRRRTPLAEYGSHRWADDAQLDAHLASVRAVGHVAERRADLLLAAAPLRHRGHLVGSLGLSLPISRADDPRATLEAIARQLQHAAEQFALPAQPAPMPATPEPENPSC